MHLIFPLLAASSREGYNSLLEFEEFLYILQHYNILPQLVLTAQKDITSVLFFIQTYEEILKFEEFIHIMQHYIILAHLLWTALRNMASFFSKHTRKALYLRNFSIFIDITIFWLLLHGLHKEIWHRVYFLQTYKEMITFKEFL